MRILHLQASTLLQVLYFMTVTASHGAKWTYMGPEGEHHWSKHYPYCGGTFQSPIDFETELLRYDPTLEPIEVRNYNLSTHEQLTLSNNGHSVQLSLPPRMHISSLPHHYSAAQLHLHWGSPSQPEGSEHTINGKRFTAEMHVVHFNSDKYPNVSMAVDKSDGLAVLGILIEIGEFHPTFNQLLKYLNGIKYKDQRIQVPAFNIRDLLPARLDEYYRYDGSLTTPPCYPSVLWTVFRNPISISQKQFMALAAGVFSSSEQESVPVPLNRNYRNPQNPEDRIVLVSFQEGRGLHGTITVTPPFLRRQIVQRLLTGDLFDLDDGGLSRVPPILGRGPGAGKKWANHNSQNSGGQAVPKQKWPRLKAADGASFGPTLWKNSQIASHVGKSGLFEGRLCYSSLQQKVSRQLKKAHAQDQLVEALWEVVFPKLNLRSYLACRSDLALPTVRFLLGGHPIDETTEVDRFLMKALYRQEQGPALHQLDPTVTKQTGHHRHQATAQKNTPSVARPYPLPLGWEWED
ncbi:carbonic anhydrase 12 isoform X1 [Megalops cyprinoides]|uniref:carbonic anhydrase 12 isoform X1 n=1 Tax=Megalops cyprinoides TaxID=118141 RepID=UPI0018644CFA|nr:carbonic anhydrase 12 isoform X1 [Megalops cyprinoides]